MFDAYSFSIDDIVNISEVQNPNESYGCPNRNCSALFLPKALNSNIAAHFCRCKNTPHTMGCFYALESSKYHDTKLMDKYSLIDILNSCNNSTNRNRLNKNAEKEQRKTNNIHTPKQLLAFCVSNSIDTVYMDKMTVGDIIIDSRNIKQNALFYGVSGIRILLGTTIRFDFCDSKIIFKITAPTKNKNNVILTAEVYADKQIINIVVKYILDKYENKFKDHQIAVMGDWKKPKEYHMQTTITNANQIIYRF